MTKTILILGIAILVLVPVTIIGSAFAQIVTVGANPISGLMVVERDIRSIIFTGIARFELFCEPGETAIGATWNGTLALAEPQIHASIYAPITDQGLSGWKLFIINDAVPQQGEVTVSVLCAKVNILSGIVGGEMMHPETTALMLAYTLVNSYWLAPIAIAIGIYLTKNRLQKH